MDLEEAALLAELRAISDRSSGSRRFADDMDPIQEARLLKASPRSNSQEQQRHNLRTEELDNSASPLAAAAATNPLAQRHSHASSDNNVHDNNPPDDDFNNPFGRDDTGASSFRKTLAERIRKSPGTRASPVVVPEQDEEVPFEQNHGTTTVAMPQSSSTFTGERGGDAKDEELLALLKGISNKSSSAHRFDMDDADYNDNNHHDNRIPEPAMTKPSVPVAATATSKQSTAAAGVPPWKRGKSQTAPKVEPAVDIVVAAPPPRGNFKSDIPNTFTGERGGDANDAELLALLRGVSNKTGASRFDGENGDGVDEPAINVMEEPMPANETNLRVPNKKSPRQSAPSNASNDTLPPWKRGKQSQEVIDLSDMDVVVAAPPKGNFKSDVPSTFNGERGGDANDAELLALLRGVSNKSGASRFDDEHAAAEETECGDRQVQAQVVSNELSVKSSSPPKSEAVTLPPWKRGKQHAASSKQPEVEIVFAEPKGSLKSDLPSTFTGERGGEANDPELLALLRGVSSKTGASRFDDDNDVAAPSESLVQEEVTLQPRPAAQKATQEKLPPWKRGKQQPRPPKEEPVIDVVVATPTLPIGGLKSEIPSTFTGERGGDANDAELLALLRGVSSKSSASRFVDHDATRSSEEEVAYSGRSATVAADPPSPKAGTPSKLRQALTRPWKREGHSQPQMSDSAASSPANGGFQSGVPSTFTGERGGDANDPELLALLRGVSKSSTSRFEDMDHPASPSVSFQGGQPSFAAQISPHQTTQAAKTPESRTTAPPMYADVQESTPLAIEDLATAVVDKDWKTRSAAFEALGTKLLQLVAGRENVWDIDGNQVLDGLDNMLPRLLAESNASALDKALGFSLLYADHCSGASSSDQARAVVSVLVKSNGFSGRPGTSKLASELVLKFIEVGSIASVNSVIDVLVTDGLASKKPKVVQSVVALIHDATTEFGVSVLPLSAITSSALKIISNPNAKVRETGINIIAEVCRTLGSKDPLQSIIAEMKAAQVKELDHLLAAQPDSVQPRRRIRQHGFSAAEAPPDALAGLQADAEERAAQRYAARPTINLMSEVTKTDYSSRLNLAKWSEKVAALSIILECAGEKPYKLAAQSSSCNYIPLINDSRKLLSHTHFAVVSKALEVLSMLAIGVGDKLFSHLRLMLLPILLLSKDKKLIKAVSSCLDSLFGNVLSLEHLLDQDDALLDATDEHKQKNALVRAAALDYLCRCVQRSSQAGPRGDMSLHAARRCAALAMDKLDDSNADVRRAASDTLKALQDCDEHEIREYMAETVAGLSTKNPRAFKALSRVSVPKTAVVRGAPKPTSAPARSAPTERRNLADTVTASSSKPETKLSVGTVPVSFERIASGQSISQDEQVDVPLSLSAALAIAGKLPIPLWGAPEDDGGVLKGLESAKGILRQDAIKSITAFVESGKLITSKDVGKDCMALILIVREHTRGLNDTNVNIMRGIIQLFLAICDVHEKIGCVLHTWSAKAGTGVAVAKISDKKACEGCKTLLSALCAVASPHFILQSAFEALQSVKSPVAHEEYLKWIPIFCGEFGAASLGRHVGDLIPFLLLEAASSNPKIKRESFNVLGVLHSHLGGQFRALVMSMAKGPLREHVESCLDASPFNPVFKSTDWTKSSLANNAAAADGESEQMLDIPKMNLIAELPDDIIARLGSKEGKAAWKHRKEALEEVETALKRCSGLIETGGSNLRSIVDLTRALELRLSDTQINLKPIASVVIARLLSVVDAATQPRIGKIVFSQLINAAMNDIKKPMRDNCIKALQCGVTRSALEGGTINVDSLEAFVSLLTGEVNEISTRAGGLTDILQFLFGLIESIPNLDDIASSRGETIGVRFAGMIVECLNSSKAETRSAATAIAEASIERGIVSVESFRKATEKLKPAQQRTIGPLIAKFTKRTGTVSETGKENDVSLGPPMQKGPGRSTDPKVGAKLTGPPQPRQSDREAHADHNNKFDTSTQHPLISRGGNQNSASLNKPVIWPEYPEEPHGASLLATLKRSWIAILPAVSVAKLFPESGISKQDDALSGIELLKLAVERDRAANMQAVESQLDFILKWTTAVLCSRETTVGMVSLLDFIVDLLKYLIEREHSLKDSEAIILTPFLLEKSGLAKGRFRDKFSEIDNLLQNGQLLSTKQFGSLVCVAVMESSSQAKARAHSCRLCMACLDSDGLVAIGKKGVLVAAKNLSEETIPENKSLSLDLMEHILGRMSGDFQKLVRTCGPSLSNHGLQLLEERWRKNQAPPMPETPAPVGRTEQVEQTTVAAKRAPKSTERSSRDQGSCIRATSNLRARLQALREKDSEPETLQIERHGEDKLDLTYSADTVDVGLLFEESMSGLKRLVSLEPPLDEENLQLQSAIDSLKKFHAALSRNQKAGSDLSIAELTQLRQIISEHLPETMEQLTYLIGFALDCTDRSVNGGISIPLLSVCLASLMALFRDPDVALTVSQDQLEILIHETGSALLDTRLSSESNISETTGSQMVRAINKLAVQAATGAASHTALLALLKLQQHVSLSERKTSPDDEVFNSRLARIYTKLFIRVIKTEEGLEGPFNREEFDLEAVLCGLEDYLVACSASTGNRPLHVVDACRDMAKKLGKALLDAHGMQTLCNIFDEMTLTESSNLVQSLGKVSEESDSLHPKPRADHKGRLERLRSSDEEGGPSGVASLVSALTNAKTDQERAIALDALREYERMHGDGDMTAHLQQVSAPFREYIERQLNGHRAGAGKKDPAAPQDGGGSMSERLRSLRTRLAAAESVVHSAVATDNPRATNEASDPPSDQVSDVDSMEPSPSFPPDNLGTMALALSSRLPSPKPLPASAKASRLARPSPSKLAQPSPSRLGGATSQSLRERLAAAAQSRGGPISPLKNPSTNMSRAAALRARLEAVKSKTTKSDEE